MNINRLNFIFFVLLFSSCNSEINLQKSYFNLNDKDQLDTKIDKLSNILFDLTSLDSIWSKAISEETQYYNDLSKNPIFLKIINHYTSFSVEKEVYLSNYINYLYKDITNDLELQYNPNSSNSNSSNSNPFYKLIKNENKDHLDHLIDYLEIMFHSELEPLIKDE